MLYFGIYFGIYYQVILYGAHILLQDPHCALVAVCSAPAKLVCCRNIGRLEGHLPPHRNYLFPDELIEISVHLCTPHQKYLCICAHRTKFTSDRDGSAPWSTQYTLYTQCTLVHLPSLAWLPHLHFGRTRYGPETKAETKTKAEKRQKHTDTVQPGFFFCIFKRAGAAVWILLQYELRYFRC